VDCVIAYVSLRTVFPYFDRHVRYDVLAIFLTYVLVAYVFIPAFMRLLRLVVPPKYSPLYSFTPDGYASDPINIGVIGSRDELIDAMQRAGWLLADKRKVSSIIKVLRSGLLHFPYPSAPMSNLFLFGRKQDLGFVLPIDNKRFRRHHVRFWATTYKHEEPVSKSSIDWNQRKSQLGFDADNIIWIGAASYDIGLSIIRHNAQVTHLVHPDTDEERELIVEQLSETSQNINTAYVRLGDPQKIVNRGWLSYLQTDGQMAVISFKQV
jgi:hypothetical protein